MDAHVILDLMREMRQSGIESLEWQAEGQSLRLVRPQPAGAPIGSGALGPAAGSADAIGADAMHAANATAPASATGVAGSVDAADAARMAGEAGSIDLAAPDRGRREGRLVASPVVGVFYAASSPDQDPYVVPGSPVEAGAPLGIIEAMKLMNEVTSPCSGTVLKILVENGQRVEYGQPLFMIKEDA